ncbi:MAG: hypothetical protein KME52_12055 [Desmonostoc geniculatum HA4340-LM1]|nr:hypothetical protein [Desmonostoc geniculatum HA4340-LM1]
MKLNLIVDREIAIVFDGLWGGRSAIYELPVRTVTFKRLNSDRAKIAALRLGYSPAIDLPHRRTDDDEIYINQWVLTGEQICPLVVVNNCCAYGADFFETCPTTAEVEENLILLELDN